MLVRFQNPLVGKYTHVSNIQEFVEDMKNIKLGAGGVSSHIRLQPSSHLYQWNLPYK